MPRLRETEPARIRADWKALVCYRRGMLRIGTLDELAKRLHCNRNTAAAWSRDPLKIRLGDLVRMCAVLGIGLDEVTALIEGKGAE